jgi:hypothetical protein
MVQSLIKENIVGICFILGSVVLFLLIMYLDRYINNQSKKFNLNSIDNAISMNKKISLQELERGLKSLQAALDDNVLNDEEYEKLKSELIKKYSS